MKEQRNGMFVLKTDEQDRLVFLGHPQDEKAMNWVEGATRWGSVICPEQIEVTIIRSFQENGELQERYLFKNISPFPLALKQTEVGIYTPFNDNYEDTDVCLEQKCHTHIFCGGQAAYIMALQMGGGAPNLGLRLRQGSIVSYSVQRDLSQESNDRGDFILHPDLPILQPGEGVEVIWDLFWFDDKEDFYQKLLQAPDFPVVRTKQCTFFVGETLRFQIEVGSRLEPSQIAIRYGERQLPYTTEWRNNRLKISCEYPVQRAGELCLDLQVGEKHTRVLFWGCPPLMELIKSRCSFLASRQQYRKAGSSLDGAYLIYDNEEEKQYYSHKDDHNGGRERISMGILMACWLQRYNTKECEESLRSYVAYVYRELYDRETGIVYNDIHRNLDWHRLYNYPWMAVFQLELFRLFENPDYLSDAYRTMWRYYQEGGKDFYGIAIPAVELLQCLQAQGMQKEAQSFRTDFIAHARQILKNGLHYPPFEVRYEQSIVAPAVSCILQAYEITREEEFLNEARRQMKVLELFNGMQPDYHQYEVAIRHWDGFWFGKRRCYGDTYPHYWSALTGIDYALYAAVEEEGTYKEKARASFRGCLSLFTEDGRASCAMVYPRMVNGQSAHYYDPWANDQDWALYFALKYHDIVYGE